MRFRQRERQNRKSPRNAQSWASIATFLTLIIYVLSLLSVLFHFNDSVLFYKIYYPIGVLVSSFGLYAIKTASLNRVLPFTISYGILFILFIIRAFQTTYLNLPGLKDEMKNDCLAQFEKASDAECQDVANGQANSIVLSVSIMVFVMGLFLYLISAYAWILQFPVLPAYDEEFGKVEDEYELPAYQGTSPLPPVYQSPDSENIDMSGTVDMNQSNNMEQDGNTISNNVSADSISPPPAAL